MLKFLLLLIICDGIDLKSVWYEYDYCFTHGSREIPPLTSLDKERIARLKQIQILFRHGARTGLFPDGPKPSYCLDFPHQFNCSASSEFEDPTLQFELLPGRDGNCLAGQLTQDGAHQLENVGRVLREAYFGDENYQFKNINNADQVYAYSSWLGRTRKSLQSMLTTLFPDISNFKAHSSPLNRRFMTPTEDCEVFNELGEVSMNNRELEEFLLKRGYSEKELLQMVDLFRDTLQTSPSNAFSMFDCVSAKVCDGMRLPVNVLTHIVLTKYSGINLEFIEDLTKLAYSLNEFRVHNQASFAVRGLYGMMTEKIKQMDEFPVVLWSGHDATLMWVLDNLQVWDGIWPPFASTMSLEFYEMTPDVDFDIGFRLVFNSRVLRLPGCNEDVCPVEVLLNRMYEFATTVEEFLELCWPQYFPETQKKFGALTMNIILTKSDGSWRFFLQFAIGIAIISCISFFCWVSPKPEAFSHESMFPYNPIPERTNV